MRRRGRGKNRKGEDSNEDTDIGLIKRLGREVSAMRMNLEAKIKRVTE